MSRNFRRIAIIVLGLIVSALLLAVAAIEVGLNGGVMNTIQKYMPQPNPESASLQSYRRTLEEQIDAELTRIGSMSGVSSYATAKDDKCYSGQNNFKVSQGFAHRCTLRITRFFGFEGDFRDFEKTLLTSGWRAGTPAYPNYFSGRKDSYFKGRIDSKFALSLYIEWAEKASTGLRRMEYLQEIRGVWPFFKRSDYQNVTEVLHRIATERPYAFGIAIEGNYF